MSMQEFSTAVGAITIVFVSLTIPVATVLWIGYVCDELREARRNIHNLISDMSELEEAVTKLEMKKK
jgi:hypothetical protein